MSIYSDSSKNTSREQPQSSRLTGTGAGGEARGAQPPAATSAASPPAWQNSTWWPRAGVILLIYESPGQRNSSRAPFLQGHGFSQLSSPSPRRLPCHQQQARLLKIKGPLYMLAFPLFICMSCGAQPVTH